MPRNFRIGVIGSTGRGDYGHGLDTAFVGLPDTEMTAVADDNPQGLQRAGQRLKIKRLYRDFREMLTKERLDIVCLGPTWVTDRLAMVEAAARAGCHIYCEKPMAGDVPSADAMLRACRQAGVKIAVAHQWRAMPPIRRALEYVAAGKYGQVLRMRARAKDDRRGGGEELIVHGTHWFDLMMAFAGRPRWVSGHVSIKGRDAVVKDATQGTQPVGPIAGDSISAMFGFDHGARGYFDSTANLFRPGQVSFADLYGVQIECERVLLQVRQPGDIYVYPAPVVQPENDKFRWERLWVEDWHFTADHKPRPMRDWLHRGNQSLARDLMQAIANNRAPLTNGQEVLHVTEMIQGVYASHLDAGRRLSIPLKQRRHPLAPPG